MTPEEKKALCEMKAKIDKLLGDDNVCPLPPDDEDQSSTSEEEINCQEGDETCEEEE